MPKNTRRSPNARGSGTPRARVRRLARAAVLIALATFVAAAPAGAESGAAELDAGDKALRGLANILTGVMAFPGEIYKNWNADGPGMGLTVGVAMGAGMIVVRELMGVFELLSSPAPWPRDDFGPIVQPPYPWNYFRE